MIIDGNLLFSDKQTVSATADSTNTIDFGAAGRNLNARVRAFAQLLNDAVGLTSLTAELRGSKDGSSWTSVATSGAVPVAQLKKGAQLFKDVPYLVDAPFRYFKVGYTVSGTATTAPVVTAGVIADGVPQVETEH